MKFQTVLEAVRSWPIEEQARLVDLIQDDLETDAKEGALSPEQVIQVERRIAAYEADPTIGIPWEQFEAHIDTRLKELGE